MIKLANYFRRGNGFPRVGSVEDDTIVDLTGRIGVRGSVEALLALEPEALKALVRGPGQRYCLSEVELLPPVLNPSKIFCVGKNSRIHREELVREGMLNEDPQEPTGFLKLVDTMVGERAAVKRPDGITTMDYEPELAFVVSRPAFHVSRQNGRSVIGGITIVNDLTAREVQKQEVKTGTRFWTAKNMPGFCPVGPVVVPLWEVSDPYDLWITCAVNGEQRLRVNTHEHIFRIEHIIEHFTRWISFTPGDVIATGAPRGTAISQPEAAELFLKPGDVCVAGLEGVMSLTTYIQ